MVKSPCRVYESVCPVGVGVHVLVQGSRHVRIGVKIPPASTCPRGPPPTCETVVRVRVTASRTPTVPRRRRRGSGAHDRSATAPAMPSHAKLNASHHQPLRYTTPPGTLWRICMRCSALAYFRQHGASVITPDRHSSFDLSYFVPTNPYRNVREVQCYSLDLSLITARRHTHDSLRYTNLQGCDEFG